MPSAQMALDLVNNRSDILPDYELELIHYDSMVSAVHAEGRESEEEVSASSDVQCQVSEERNDGRSSRGVTCAFEAVIYSSLLCLMVSSAINTCILLFITLLFSGVMADIFNFSLPIASAQEAYLFDLFLIFFRNTCYFS